MISSPGCPSPSTAGWRASSKIMKVGELVASLTSYNTRESGPCTSPEQQDRVGLSSRGVAGELALRSQQ